jgi:hypothetical protein
MQARRPTELPNFMSLYGSFTSAPQVKLLTVEIKHQPLSSWTNSIASGDIGMEESRLTHLPYFFGKLSYPAPFPFVTVVSSTFLSHRFYLSFLLPTTTWVGPRDRPPVLLNPIARGVE